MFPIPVESLDTQRVLFIGICVAEACRASGVALIAAPLPSALVLTDPFFGLGTDDQTGKVVLMQGDHQ